MKKCLSTLWIFFLVFCLLPVPAFAASGTYELDELGMSIEIPSDHVVFTRDIKSDDPNLSAYGLTKDGLSSLMLERGIYLNAWDKDVNYEIIVTMAESPFEDYNQFSDTVLNGLVSALETEYAAMGITLIRSELYRHSQAKFAKIYISQPNGGETAYGVQYNTVYDGKAINITLQSYSGQIDSSKEAIIQKIVDTVHFDGEPRYSELPAQTEAFTYTDKDSGMTFTVPANWVESPVSEESGTVNAKFTSNLEEGLSIAFLCQDLYELDEYRTELSATERFLLTRDMIGNDTFTKSDVAEMYGCEEKDVTMVTYGGKEYYSAEVVTTTTSHNLALSLPMTCLLRCENACMYMFVFNGHSSSEYFRDFEELVSSAKYPEFEDDGAIRNQVLGAYLLLAVIALIALCVLIVFVCRSVIRKKYGEKNRQANNSMIEDSPAKTAIEPVSDAPRTRTEAPIPPEPPVSEDIGSIAFCHRCGNKLTSGSLFCNKCGTKVPTAEE